MKAIIVFILVSCMQVSAHVYAQEKLTLDIKNAEVSSVLTQIQKMSSYRFFYNYSAIKKLGKVDVQVKDATLVQVLNAILKDNLTFGLEDDNVVVIGNLNAENRRIKISGKVIDDLGLPLIGVSVKLQGTNIGASTNENGLLTIEAPEDGILEISYIGFQKKLVPVSGKSELTIVLQAVSSDLNEVVVVAYGAQRKTDVTGSLATVKAEEFKDIPVSQVAQKLQGKLAGVVINQTTGIPGQGMSIRIRGAASIGGGTQPLYVVDGFPIVGDIGNINPDEIQSFTVLKDASATSLYGSRAANGVVLVETKRAKNGQSDINFTAFYGTQQVPKKGRPQMLNGVEFAQYMNDVFTERIRLGQASSIPIEYQNPAQYEGKATNWYNQLLRDAPIQNYSLSINSGKDKLSTSATVGYMGQKGVLIGTDYKRYSLRLNSDYKFNEILTVGINVAPSYETNATPNVDGNIFGGGIIQNAIATSPIAPAINPDGSLPLTATSPGLFANPNWYRVAQEVKNNTQKGRILSNAYLNLEIIKDLNFKSTMNLDYTNIQNQTWNPSTSGALFSPPPIIANASNNTNIYYSWLSENTLNYKKDFANHHFDALIGYTAQKFHQNTSGISGFNFPNDKIESLSAATQFNTPTFGIEEWSLISFVSRLNYNYKSKYLLAATFRRDGSSRFAPNSKYGNFPSISAGWNISEESFMSSMPFVSYLKLRAGYGLNGNFNIGNYGYLASTGAMNYPFNNTLGQGITINSLGNNDLSWEKSKQLDIGLDIGILDNRIYFSYDYFNKTTTDMLLSIPVPLESGFNSIVDNAGKFKFYGHEFSLSTKNLIGNVKWSTDFNITFIGNNVVDLGPYSNNLPRNDINGPNITQIGSPIGAFYGYKFIGVYMDQQDFDSSPKYLGAESPSGVGTVKYADINGDGVITTADKTIIGNPNPKFTFGMTNTLSYKNFDFSTVIAGSVGNDIENRTLEYIQNLDGVFNVTKDVLNRWKSPSDPGNGIHPRILVSTPLARTTNSRWVSDGSYLTLKNITLGYTLPFKELKYLKSIRLYSSIQQAWVFTNYNGANPEVNASGADALVQGVDYTSYPVPRTFSFGINMNLK